MIAAAGSLLPAKPLSPSSVTVTGKVVDAACCMLQLHHLKRRGSVRGDGEELGRPLGGHLERLTITELSGGDETRPATGASFTEPVHDISLLDSLVIIRTARPQSDRRSSPDALERKWLPALTAQAEHRRRER